MTIEELHQFTAYWRVFDFRTDAKGERFEDAFTDLLRQVAKEQQELCMKNYVKIIGAPAPQEVGAILNAPSPLSQES